MSQKAFTLIEIVISIAIISILLGISMTVFRALTDDQTIDRDVENVVSYILRARNQTITGENNANYGVYFASSSITLFQGKEIGESSPSDLTFDLNNRTFLSSINLTDGLTLIYFNKGSGSPSATGTIEYQLIGHEDQKKLIKVYASGLVEVQ